MSWTPSHAADIDFAPGLQIDAGGSALVAGHIDGDTLKDVVVIKGGSTSWVFAWYQQQSTGSWIRHDLNAQGTIGGSTRDFVGAAQLIDIDGDGDDDLIWSVDGHHGAVSAGVSIHLWENPGAPACYSAVWPHREIARIAPGQHCNDMRLGDLDGDGKTDVVLRHKSADDVVILFQNSKSSWTKVTAYTGLKGEGLAVGDIDDDGKDDITFTGFWFKAPANPRNGNYTRYDIHPQFHSKNWASKDAIGDINNDGRPDVVISPAEYGDTASSYGGANYDLAWFEAPANPQTGTWIKHTLKSNFNHGHMVRIADFDNDGHRDVVSGTAWSTPLLVIYRNNGNGGSFTGHTLSTTGGGYSGAITDIDGDGDIDIVSETAFNQPKAYFYKNKHIDGGGSPDTQAPTKPGNLLATATSATAIALSWSVSTDNVGVTGYQISRGTTVLTTVTGTSYTNSGLTPATAYSYTVRARDAAGNLSAAASASATTQAATDTQAPTVPSNLVATATASTVVLSWSASSDNVGVTGYEIRRDGSLLTTTATTGYTDAAVTAGSIYSYTVLAVDAVGNGSAQSQAASATVPGGGGGEVNLALGAAVTVSSGSGAANLTDGVHTTTSRWMSLNGLPYPQWAEVDLGQTLSLSEVRYLQNAQRTEDFQVEVWTGSSWQQVASGTDNSAMDIIVSFPAIDGSKVRFTVESGTYYQKVYELEVYGELPSGNS